MAKHIRTSEANKEVVSKLTRKLNLGTENIIARIALSYSLAQEQKMNINNIEDSKGKEYSVNVLFGENYPIYVGMLAVMYNLNNKDKTLFKYLKMHLDHGLNLLDKSFISNNSQNLEFLKSKIEFDFINGARI